MSSGQNWQSFSPRSDRFAPDSGNTGDHELLRVVNRAKDWLLEAQTAGGFWQGIHQADISPTAELILLSHLLSASSGLSKSSKVFQEMTSPALMEKLAAHLHERQLPGGGWSQNPESGFDLDLSVLVYLALRVSGDFATSLSMQRAATRIRTAGGAEACGVITRYYLAVFGVISFNDCPVIPAELLLLPRWAPLNLERLSAWAQDTLLPLSVIWTNRLSISTFSGSSEATSPGSSNSLEEVFLTTPIQMPRLGTKQHSASDHQVSQAGLSWRNFVLSVESIWRFFEAMHVRPFRWRSQRLARKWLFHRLESLPVTMLTPRASILSIMALTTFHKDACDPLIESQLEQLQKLLLITEKKAALSAWSTSVSDSAMAVQSLREAGVSPQHPRLLQAVNWLIGQQISPRTKIDSKQKSKPLQAVGWNPAGRDLKKADVQTTVQVIQAIRNCLPGHSGVDWSASLISQQGVRPQADFDLSFVVSTQTASSTVAVGDMARMQPMIQCMQGAIRWLASMQNADGGWSRYDVNLQRDMLTDCPGYDPTLGGDATLTDVTAQILQLFGDLGLANRDPTFERAIKIIWDAQEVDNCWKGDFGVSYIWGTSQVISGLVKFGVPLQDSRIQAAGRWLKEKQNSDGGWGESPESCQFATLRGRGPSTPEQTAWALMGLMAIDELQADSVHRGVQYLIKTQSPDGTWNQGALTFRPLPGHAFDESPVISHCYPLIALSRYLKRAG